MRDLAGGVLLVTRNHPPLVGGMERLNQHLLLGLSRQFRTCLIGPRGASAFTAPSSQVLELAHRPLWRFLLGCLIYAVRHARMHRPDLVMGGSALLAPVVWLAARLSGARAGLYVHGLDLVVEHWIYQRFWVPFVRRCDVVICNSRHTRGLALDAGVAADRLHVVHPGTSMAQTVTKSDGACSVTAEVAALRLLFVGRLTPRKGLSQFVAECMPRIMAAHPKASLLVVGTEPIDALLSHAGSEKERVLDAAQRAGVAGAIRFVERISDEDLAKAYASSSVLVFPVRETRGDVEGFGMVAIEAAAHGLPTVAYAVGGVPDAIEDGVTGALVTPGDSEAFAAAVLDWMTASREAHAGCRAHAARFSWDRFHAELARALARTTD